MPIARVQLPDGRIARVEVPDGTTPEQAMAFARQAAGKQPKPAPQKSAWQHARDIGENALAGAVTAVGSIPDTLIEGTAALERGVVYGIDKAGGAALRAFGMNDAADKLSRGAAMADRGLARPMTVRRAVDQYAPVKPGYETSRLVTELGVGAMIPFGPKGVPQARIPVAQQATKQTAKAAQRAAGREVVNAGKRAGVRVMTTDVVPPRTFIGKSAQAIGERVPYAGTGGVRQAQQVERIAAVRQLADDFGASVDDPVIDAVAKDLAKTRGAELTKLSGAKNRIIDGIGGTVPTDRTATAIGEQVARLEALRLPELAPVISKLNGWKSAIQGQSLRNVEDIRKSLGKAFSSPDLAHIADEGQKSLNAIYAPLRAEMGTFIANRGGQAALKQWQGANGRLAAMAGELKAGTFKRVLADVDSTPENVAKLLFSGKPSDVRRLTGSLSAAGRAKAKAALIQRAIEKGGGLEAISPDRFANEMGRLSKSVGIVFDGSDLARVEGLTRLLDATKRAGAAAAAPPTGVQNSVPILAAVLTDMMGGAGAALTSGTIGGLVARAYESGPVRDSLLKLARTKAGSQQEAVMLNRAAGVIAPLLERARSAINDNMAGAAAQLPGRVAAEEQVSDSGGAPPQP